ncbi:MAG TPA: hypothetical protein VK590_05955 [Saprospiraceae bacterium]|nr:hypothetical protein [Saprospiraceae bacterium]
MKFYSVFFLLSGLVSFNALAQNRLFNFRNDINNGLFSMSMHKYDELSDSLDGKPVLPDTTFTYLLNFGDLHIKASNESFSNVRNVKYASINELVEYLNSPLKFSLNGLPVNGGYMDINLYKFVFSYHKEHFYKRMGLNFKMEIKENTILDKYIANKISENLDSLDLIIINIYKEEGARPLASFNIGSFGSNFKLEMGKELANVFYENGKYSREIPISMSQRHLSKDYFNSLGPQVYQLIDDQQRQVLRTDTTEASIKSFLRYYKSKSDAEVIHLPGFRSKDRFVDFNKDWGQQVSCSARTELMSIQESDLIHCFEYCPVSDSVISLSIGDLLSDWRYKLYYKTWFLKNVEKGLVIRLPEGDFSPVSLEIILYDDKSDIHFIRTDNINNPLLQTVWNKLPELAGLYIQNIVFIDKLGKRTRIPNSFIFYTANSAKQN